MNKKKICKNHKKVAKFVRTEMICPYCGALIKSYCSDYSEGDTVYCYSCGDFFALGNQTLYVIKL